MMYEHGTNEKIGVFFDFDGVWFPTDRLWNLRDIHLGPLGTAATWYEACCKLEGIRQSNEKASIHDYYTASPAPWEILSEKELHLYNVTPPDKLKEVAWSHTRRSHDMYLFSQGNCPELFQKTDIEARDPKAQRMQIQPFRNIAFLSLFLIGKETKMQAADFYVRRKMYALLASLQWVQDVPEEIQRAAGQGLACNKAYTKIFLYYTQREYKAMIQAALKQYCELLAAKRMALIPSYIALAQS